MRYPGSHKHEKVIKRSVVTIALIIFGLGFVAATSKQRQTQADQVLPVTNTSPTVSSPQLTPTSMTTLQLFDRMTKIPLTGQSIVFLATVECLVPPCPASSPLVITADARGRIVIGQDILKLRPKIYAAGYKLDSYFSFLDSTKPTVLTLYQPMEGTKVNYDITLEDIPIGLTPVKPQ